MRKFTKFTLFLAMLMMVSSGGYAAPDVQGDDTRKDIVVGYDNAASGGLTSAYGNNNEVHGNQSNAFGYLNKVEGSNSSAFGFINNTSGSNSLAVGGYNNYCFDMTGTNPSAPVESGAYSNAIGFNNFAKGDYSLAIGDYNNVAVDEYGGDATVYTSGKYSTAVGYSNTALGEFGSSVGGYNTNDGENSSAFGYSNYIYGPDIENSNAFGMSNEVYCTNGNAFGSSNQVTESGESSSAFGRYNIVSGASSSAFGDSNQALGESSNAFGNLNYVQGSNNNAFGSNNYFEMFSDTNAFGSGNSIWSDDSNLFGSGNTTKAGYSNAFGNANYSEGEHSNTFGEANYSYMSYGSAFGYGNRVGDTMATVGNYSTAVGYQNIAEGNNSSAFGFESKASADNSTALGYQAVAGESGTVSFGHSSTDLNFSGDAYGSDLEAKLTHVATGTALTDAVNRGQLEKYVAENAGGSLTTEQLAAANSGITADKVGNYDTAYNSFISIVTPVTGGAFRISKVADAVNDDDAVNYGQVKNSFVNASFDSTTRKLTLTNVNGSTVDVEIPGGSGSGSDPELESKVTQNTTDIATNKTAIAQNTTDIATNKTNIAKNSSEIENIKKTQEGLGIASSKKNDNTFSDGSIAIGSKNESGKDTKVAMTIGSNNVVVGKNSIAIGYAIKGKNNDFIGNTVKGDYSIAVGYGHTITGNNSGAFGDPSDISGHGSYAIGNDNKITGNGSFIVGNNGNVSGANSVAIGNQSVATADNVVSFGHSAGDEKGQEGGTYEEDLNRRLIHVADAQDDNDAVNYGQMKDYVAANAGNSGEVIKLRNDLNKMDGRISKVGASAGALAALKPMEFDPDNKWSAGVGFGNLNGKNAAAVGLFYRPNRDVYYSLGGNVGGEENIVNAGINFSFGHRSEKPVEVRHYTVVHDNAVGVSNVNTVDAAEFDVFCQENAELKEKVAAQDAEIISQKNEISDLKYRIKHLERLMLKMSKK